MSVDRRPGAMDAERTVSVRQHLRDILASDAFKGGKRAQDFLQLIVEHALAGRLDSLRERMLGAEMFGRPIDYDTANDAVVRVKATEVRKRLTQYYQSLSAPPPVRIVLPAGSYLPQFIFETTPVAAPAVSVPEVNGAEAGSGSKPSSGELAPSLSGTAEVPVEPPKSSRRPILLVAGVALAAILGTLAFLAWRHFFSSPQIRSIAILPLQNFSGDPGQEYFADGMTEELTTDLGQVSSLRVISRTSTMTYKGTKKTLPEIARELQVDAIVEGSIEREGNRVRITTQLIDSRTDQHIWSHSYDRDMISVLELQSEVARAIAEQIRIQLTPSEQARLNRSQQINPEAVELYLQGRQHENTADPKGSVAYFRQAIEKDPSYAAAHAALANVYGWMGEAGWMPYAEAFSKQKQEALKAIELDDSRPEPHLELGLAAMNQSWDWATEQREIQRALELGPNSADVLVTYANYLDRLGRTNEAVAQGKLALQLDPVSSRSFLNTAFICYFARQYDLAIEQMQRAAALQHQSDESYFPLGVIYVEKGLYEEGIQQFLKIGDQPHALGHLGNAYARKGSVAEARQAIEKLKAHIEKTNIGNYEIALVYAGLKENDQAFEWLEKAYQAHDKGLTYLKIDPCLDPLRSDPRFQALVKRVGIPS